MNDWPPVIALIVTYRRLDLALATIRSVLDHVDYPNIGFHIADDGSGEDYVKKLLAEIGGSYSVVTTDAAQQGGVGLSMNMGIKAVLTRADYWLHLEDDWVLPGPLDLRPCVQVMAEDDTVGMVRLGRLSAGLEAESYSGAGKLWWRLKRGSDTYVFSGNAALRHRRFHDAYGPYKAKLHPGQTELWYCDRFNRREGPDILWPAWMTYEETFQHIGDHESFKWHMEADGRSGAEIADMFDRNREEATT